MDNDVQFRALECFQSLVGLHRSNSLSQGNPFQADDYPPQNLPLPANHQIARLFAIEAAKTLTSPQFRQLQSFLENPWKDKAKDAEYLKQQLMGKLQTFYSEEIQISGEDRIRLAAPGGAPDADLGLILHVQSEDDAIDGFWDPRSATIELLGQKGITSDTCFGYDWHWRAQTSFDRHKARCPAAKWSARLKKLHNKLSQDLLELLPLPFVITASSCTRDNLRKYLSKTTKSLEIVLVPVFGILKFDLDFQENVLRRIILHTVSITRFQDSSKPPKIENQWGFKLTAVSTSSCGCWANRLHSHCKTPIPELWRYVKQESDEQRVLKLEEFSTNFINWAGRYISYDPSLILMEGKSLARVVADKVIWKIQRNHVKVEKGQQSSREKKGKGQRQAPGEKTSKARQALKGKKQQQKQPSMEDKGGQLQNPLEKKSVQRLRDVVESKLLDHPHLADKTDALVPLDKVDERCGGEEHANNLDQCKLAAQHDDDKQCHHEDEKLDLSSQFGQRKSADEEMQSPQGRLEPKSFYVSAVDEIEIPRPLDDLPDDEDKCASSGVEFSLHSTEENLEMISCCGTIVKVYRNGTLTVMNATYPLHMKTTPATAREILAAGGDPKIYFSSTDIEIRINDTPFYNKSIERLLTSPEAALWLCQLLHEEKCGSLEQKQDGAPKSELVILPRDPQGYYWNHGELRRRLLQGDIFHCKESHDRSGKSLGKRVYLRGAQIWLPMDAEDATVHVKASIVAKGQIHENECILKGGQVDDPAHRLGVEVTYRTMDGESKTFWWKSSADGVIKKMNSTVDFLEGRDTAFTEKQPRRFLSKERSRGRPKDCYTT